MAKRLRLRFDRLGAAARLHEAAAPKTGARLWAALPFDKVRATASERGKPIRFARGGEQ